MKEKKSDKKVVAVSISSEEKTMLKALAFMEGKTISSIASECFRKGLERRVSRNKENVEAFLKLSSSFGGTEDEV